MFKTGKNHLETGLENKLKNFHAPLIYSVSLLKPWSLFLFYWNIGHFQFMNTGCFWFIWSMQ